MIPKPQYIAIKVKDYQNVYDIVAECIKAVNNSYQNAKPIHDLIISKTKSDIEYLYAVWKYAKSQITYNKEPIERQTAREFQRIFYDKEGDCKHFSIFIASIIKNHPRFKDKLKFRITDSGKGFKHIYVIADDYVIDGTASKFHWESPKIVRFKDFKI